MIFLLIRNIKHNTFEVFLKTKFLKYAEYGKTKKYLTKIDFCQSKKCLKLR